jgi:hypothetical protein
MAELAADRIDIDQIRSEEAVKSVLQGNGVRVAAMIMRKSVFSHGVLLPTV